MRSAVLLALPLFAACSDYEINVKDDAEPQGGDAEPIEDVDDTGEPQDTGSTDGTSGDEGLVEIPATEPIYINEDDRLFSWDPDGDELVEIGSWDAAIRMTDIAIDARGQLWGCTGDALYTIDPETADTTWMAPLDAYLSGLTFLADGRLVGAGDGVWVLDTLTGARTETLVEPGDYTTSGDIVGLPDGLLYWTVWGEESGEADVLMVIDPAGGFGTRGEVEVDRVFGLGFAYGDLYGFTDEGDWVQINHELGGLRRQGPLPGTTGWWGATTNPVRWD